MSNTMTPVNKAFIPLYSLLANDRPSDGVTREYLQNDYSKRKKENKEPNWFQKRSLTEIIGGILGLGGAITWLASSSKVSKWLSGIATVGGIGAIITGVLNIIDLKPQTSETAQPDAVTKTKATQPEVTHTEAVNKDSINNSSDINTHIAALKDEDSEVRHYGAHCLIEIGKTAVDPVLELLNNDSQTVKAIAAKILGEIGDPKAVDPLIGLLKNKDFAVRAQAAKALGKIGDLKAVDILLNTALKDRSAEVRIKAVRALKELDPAKAFDTFSTALGDDKQKVMQAAVVNLIELNDPKIILLFEALASELNPPLPRKTYTDAIEKIKESQPKT